MKTCLPNQNTIRESTTSDNGRYVTRYILNPNFLFFKQYANDIKLKRHSSLIDVRKRERSYVVKHYRPYFALNCLVIFKKMYLIYCNIGKLDAPDKFLLKLKEIRVF